MVFPMTNINIEVDTEIYRRFKAYCSLYGYSVKGRVTYFIKKDADVIKEIEKNEIHKKIR